MMGACIDPRQAKPKIVGPIGGQRQLETLWDVVIHRVINIRIRRLLYVVQLLLLGLAKIYFGSSCYIMYISMLISVKTH